MMLMKKTTIYLPEKMAIDIQTRAKQDHRSEADVIREALGNYLAEEKRPLPSIVGMGSGGKITGEDSEDWLMENWDVE